MTDICQCPTWGVVHAQRQFETNARAMALEAGGVMHEAYGALRIWQLEHIQGLPKHALETAKRIFGAKRWKTILSGVKAYSDEREHLLELLFATLHSAGWYDDPNDNVRTMSNMEMSAIKYVDERFPYLENWPIYVADKKNPRCIVGIEQPFDIVLHYADGKKVRVIGTIDGLVTKSVTGDYYIDENKTASRLDDGWRQSFEMSHQITGYCAATTTVFGFTVLNARVTGAKIKPTNRGEDVLPIEISRDESAIRHWGRWVRYCDDTWLRYKDDYENAPRFTHSCNRYFRPCSLISFCADSPQGRKEQWDQMVPADLSPSERAIQEI